MFFCCEIFLKQVSRHHILHQFTCVNVSSASKNIRPLLLLSTSLFVLLAHPLLRPSMLLLPSLLGVVTSLRSSQESDSPLLLLLLSSSAPAPAFHLSSTFTPRLRHSSVLHCSSSPPIPHPSLSRGPSVTCLVVTMATCILCWNPWETPLDPRGSPEGRGEGRALTQLW